MGVTRGNPILADLPMTVFDEMSGLAREHRAINLGQGFPDGPGPRPVLEKAAEAILTGNNALLELICEQRKTMRRAMRSLIAFTRRDLPMPGSPMISTTWPSPALARSHKLSSVLNWDSRPMNGVSPRSLTASNRLAAPLSAIIRYACTALAMFLRL